MTTPGSPDSHSDPLMSFTNIPVDDAIVSTGHHGLKDNADAPLETPYHAANDAPISDTLPPLRRRPLPPLPRPWIDLGFQVTNRTMHIVYNIFFFIVIVVLVLYYALVATSIPDVIKVVGCTVVAVFNVIWLLTTISPDFPFERNVMKVANLLCSTLSLAISIFWLPLLSFAIGAFCATWAFRLSVVACPNADISKFSTAHPRTIYICPPVMPLDGWLKPFFYLWPVSITLLLLSAAAYNQYHTGAFLGLFHLFTVLIFLNGSSIHQPAGFHVRSDASIGIELSYGTVILENVARASLGWRIQLSEQARNEIWPQTLSKIKHKIDQVGPNGKPLHGSCAKAFIFFKEYLTTASKIREATEFSHLHGLSDDGVIVEYDKKKVVPSMFCSCCCCPMIVSDEDDALNGNQDNVGTSQEPIELCLLNPENITEFLLAVEYAQEASKSSSSCPKQKKIEHVDNAHFLLQRSTTALKNENENP